MRSSAVIAAVFIVGLTSRSAMPAPPAPDEVKDASPPVTFGYKVESGVATTWVVRGLPMYISKTDPLLASTAELTFENLGPGNLSVGATNETALAEFNDQKGNQLRVCPQIAYSVTFAERLTTKLGFVSYLYPEKSPVDGMDEVYAIASVEKLPVTPSLGVYGEVVRTGGFYGFGALSKKLSAGQLAFTPKILAAATAYAGVDGKRSAALGLREATASLAMDWSFVKPLYLSLRGAYSFTGLPASQLPAGHDTFLGRSTPTAMLAFGATR